MSSRADNIDNGSPHTEKVTMGPRIFGFKFRTLAGYGYGLRQRVMEGEIALTEVASQRLGIQLRKAMALSGESKNEQESFAAKTDGGIEVVLALYFKLQQYAKIPLFEEHKIANAKSVYIDQAKRIEGMAYKLVIPYWHPEASKQVLELISKLANETASSEIDHFMQGQRIRRFGLDGTNAYPFAKAGWELGLYCDVVDGRTIQLGIGSQASWLDSSLTDRASLISVRLSKDKQATHSQLKNLGFPVARQLIACSAEEAVAIQKSWQRSIVIKPKNQDQGRGITIDVRATDEIKAAYAKASEFGSDVIVEEHVDGRDYRLTVFNNSVIKVVLREPLSVVGDGIATIEELLKRKSELPHHKRETLASGKNPFRIDKEIMNVLSSKSMDTRYIPKRNEQVYLRKASNISTGGSQTLICLDQVHPENIRLAVCAAQSLKLDICGVDMLIKDIKQPWRHAGGKIIELNAQPQIGTTLAPELYLHILRGLKLDQSPCMLLLVVPNEAWGANPTDSRVERILQHYQKPIAAASSRRFWEENEITLERPEPSSSMIKAALRISSAQTLLFMLTQEEFFLYGLPTHQLTKIYLASKQDSGGIDPEYLGFVKRITEGVPIETIEWSRDE